MVKYYHDNHKISIKVGNALSESGGTDRGSKRVKFNRRAQYPEMEAKLYIGVQGSAEEGIEGERTVVSSMCKADSH